jgi:hypothetical protein
MVKRVLLVGMFIIFLLSFCSSVRVMVDYDETVNFDDYSTYCFVRPKRQQTNRPGSVRSPFITKEIMNEIKPIMESKGFSEAETKEQADLIVVFYASIQRRSDYVPPAYRVGRWGRVWRARPGHVVRYKEGTLVIDIVDQNRKELVWQGIGKGVLDRDNPAENLVEAVEKVLEKFPPQ